MYISFFSSDFLLSLTLFKSSSFNFPVFNLLISTKAVDAVIFLNNFSFDNSKLNIATGIS